MFEFIFYAILFYIIIKSLNALVRWWGEPGIKSRTTSGQGNNNSNYSKYKDVEEVQFTEIKSDSKKDKV
jgi:hypothetical protein